MKKRLIGLCSLAIVLAFAGCSSGTYLTPYSNTDQGTSAATNTSSNSTSSAILSTAVSSAAVPSTTIPPNFITYWPNYAYMTIQNGSTWYGFKMMIWSNSSSYVGEFTDTYTTDGHYGMGPIGPGINVASFDFLEPVWAAIQFNNHALDNGPCPSSGYGPHSILNEPSLADNAISHEPDLSPWGHFYMDPSGTWKISLMAKLSPGGPYENIPFRGMPSAHPVVAWPN